MKEATGELNMTVVTVVAIVAVGAFFYAMIWPNIRANIERNTNCAQAICDCPDGNSVCNCTYIDKNGSTVSNYACPNKNK